MTSVILSEVIAEPMPECFIDCGTDIVGCAGKCIMDATPDIFDCITGCGQANLKCLANCTGDELPKAPAPSPKSFKLPYSL
uniref:Uncharacterized protein n=1 Tax=Chenopodium quinoa TaxID=63459 RepID=A0A803L993_CHEQI